LTAVLRLKGSPLLPIFLIVLVDVFGMTLDVLASA
jgi:hypothetical protein